MKRTWTIVFVFALMIDVLCIGNSFGEDPRPNIVFVLADDLGKGDLACYGGKVAPTPSIDRLAENGIRFNRYYSASPICSPSRCGLITGQFPSRWNVTSFMQTREGNRNCEQVDFLDPRAPSLPRFLQQAGYATAHIGKWHLGGGRDVVDPPVFAAYGYRLGLGTYESPEPAAALGLKTVPWGKEVEPQQVPRHERTRWMVDETLAFLKKHSDQPCFVNLWLDDTHTPWVPNDAVEGKGAARANLVKVIEKMDEQIGRLAGALPPNTLLIFASDNGALPTFNGVRSIGNRGSKLSLYEGGICLPFIVHWPGFVQRGRVDESTIMHAVDMLPTLAAIADVKLPADYSGDGIDMSKALRGQSLKRDRALYWEYGRNETAFKYPEGADRSPSLAMIDGDWKFLVNSDGSGAELYDLSSDRSEGRNLVANQGERASGMKRALLEWRANLPKLPSRE